jgi:flagellar biosynthesis protein FlhB
VVQAGGPAFRFPAPSLKRLDPAAGLRRMFGRDAATGIAKALATATAVACATFPAVRDAFAANAANAGAVALVGIVGGALVFAFAGASATAVVFAAVDLALERAKWKRRLRMSFAELKRDLKQTEGDPLQRGRRRQAHRDLVRGSIGRLKDAAFVIANPTHVAIALEYAPPAVAVPRVLIRAVDAGARAVVERARILGVPVVRNVALARALLATAEVGRPIPRDQYGAVAFVVASLARAGALK